MKKIDYYSHEFKSRNKTLRNQLEDRERRVLQQLKALSLEPGSSILDVGCGDGYFLKEMCNKLGNDLSFFGIEYSPDERKNAADLTGFEIFSMDLESGLKFPENHFNVVYLGEVLEHLYDPDNAVNEVRRILCKNGYLLLTTPNMNSWISRILFVLGFQPLTYECSTLSSEYGFRFLKRFKQQDWPVGHVRLFNRFSLVDLLEANGFRIDSVLGARSEVLPAFLSVIDSFFARFSSVSSTLIVVARK